ncbi:outer membrane beta-barrel protein [bacterium]|nr:outer membrane beta-barrel protein [candidate division CSSED10-310 bacterium]
MRNGRIGIAAVIIGFLGFIPAVSAVEFHATIGLEYWYADYEYKALAVGSDEYVTYSADTDGLYGPTLHLSFDKFFIGATYRIGTFSFEQFENEGDRKDFNLFAGYTFGNHFSLRLQYETMNFTHDFDATSGRDQTQTALGLSASAFTNIGESGFFVYGSFTYAPFGEAESELYWSTDKISEKEDAVKWNGEAGLSYSFKVPLSITAGYRYNKTTTENDILEVEFKGPFLYVSYRF